MPSYTPADRYGHRAGMRRVRPKPDMSPKARFDRMVTKYLHDHPNVTSNKVAAAKVRKQLEREGRSEHFASAFRE